MNQVTLQETRTVIKRNGSPEALDIRKIRKVISWACQGTSINPFELEASFSKTLKDRISTRTIQQQLIHYAYKKISVENPEWRLIAGRLFLFDLRKEVSLARGLENKLASYSDFYQHVIEFTKKRLYTHKLLSSYTKEELILASSFIVPDYDLYFDYGSLYTLQSRYLIKGEMPQELFMVNALLLASEEEAPIRMHLVKQYYDLLASRKISLATPLLKNLRTESGSLTSCFILTLGDSLDELFDSFHRIARISKAGGGVGVYASYIRATGAPVMGQDNASGGVMPWIKIINDISVGVNQVGARAGAVTVALDVWHYDLLELLDCQTENGDIRKKAYDIFPQVVVNDLFFENAVQGRDWFLVDPYEVKQILGIDLPPLWGKKFAQAYSLITEAIYEGKIKRYRKIKAKEIIKLIMRSQLETGLPYIAFKDAINEGNPNKHSGFIPCVNLCVESFSNVSKTEDHCCNLASLNLAALVDATDEELKSVCYHLVRILDSSIDLTTPPNPEAKQHNLRYRTIGVGTMGLADWLAYKEYKFNNLGKIENLFEDISLYCVEASNSLAIEKGSYDRFTNSEWSKGKLINSRSLADIESSCQEKNRVRWQEACANIQKYGIRNSQLLAIAPNTSTALIMEATPSILPVFSKIHDFTNNLGSIPIVPPYLKEKFWFYEENKYIEQEVVVNLVSCVQKWIDTGISMELMFNLNPGIYPSKEGGMIGAEDIYNIYVKAWKQRCKAIYYIRSVDKLLNKEEGKSECSSCSG